jgi:hypothetical protein
MRIGLHIVAVTVSVVVAPFAGTEMVPISCELVRNSNPGAVLVGTVAST